VKATIAIIEGDGIGTEVVPQGVKQGYRTYDIMEPGKIKVGTNEMGDHIAAAIGA
jgi:isocitrate/isopropylmalate dehydrogenase